ncbi:acyltransferase family protein [Hymenobacter sp. IS2118]|uniref:acyltransferase family protein n=1 Tax=Hymenobacter sp. IS2118 TaxID=1505605 RepID=UPI0009074ACD|nr:acyltransferase [Hymenobacter sp. IS2118]
MRTENPPVLPALPADGERKSEIPTPGKVRFYELDVVRFIAALAVVLFHYSYNGFKNGKSPIQFSEIDFITRYGYLGVELFFVVSGFLISLSAENATAKKFVLSRIVRLYPMYWVACTLTTVIIIVAASNFVAPTLFQYGLNMTMFQEFFDVDNIDGVYWTLAYELQFYFLIYLLLLTNRFRHIDVFAGTWIVISTLLLLAGKYHISNAVVAYANFFFFPHYSPYFIAGILFYLIHKKGFKLWYGLGLAITYLLCIWLAVSKKSPFTTHSPIVIAAVVTLILGVFLLISLKKLQMKGGKTIAKAGVITYPLYLVHAYIGYIILQNISVGIYINKYILLIVMTVFFVVGSYWLNVWIEKPMATRMMSFLKSRKLL